LDYLASLPSPQKADPPEDDISHKFIPKKVRCHVFFALMLSKYFPPFGYLEDSIVFGGFLFFGSALVSKQIRIELFKLIRLQIRSSGARSMWIHGDPDPEYAMLSQ
jgi:hypothetical protein